MLIQIVQFRDVNDELFFNPSTQSGPFAIELDLLHGSLANQASVKLSRAVHWIDKFFSRKTFNSLVLIFLHNF